MLKPIMRMLFPALLLAGCLGSSSTVPEGTSPLFTVEGANGRIILENTAVEPLHYVVIEEVTATLIDLHFDPTTWPAIQPGRRAFIRYEDVTGYHPAATAAVIYGWARASGYTSQRVALR